jgi:hypothetical protein
MYGLSIEHCDGLSLIINDNELLNQQIDDQLFRKESTS